MNSNQVLSSERHSDWTPEKNCRIRQRVDAGESRNPYVVSSIPLALKTMDVCGSEFFSCCPSSATVSVPVLPRPSSLTDTYLLNCCSFPMENRTPANPMPLNPVVERSVGDAESLDPTCVNKHCRHFGDADTQCDQTRNEADWLDDSHSGPKDARLIDLSLPSNKTRDDVKILNFSCKSKEKRTTDSNSVEKHANVLGHAEFFQHPLSSLGAVVGLNNSNDYQPEYDRNTGFCRYKKKLQAENPGNIAELQSISMDQERAPNASLLRNDRFAPESGVNSDKEQCGEESFEQIVQVVLTKHGKNFEELVTEMIKCILSKQENLARKVNSCSTEEIHLISQHLVAMLFYSFTAYARDMVETLKIKHLRKGSAANAQSEHSTAGGSLLVPMAGSNIYGYYPSEANNKNESAILMKDCKPLLENVVDNLSVPCFQANPNLLPSLSLFAAESKPLFPFGHLSFPTYFPANHVPGIFPFYDPSKSDLVSLKRKRTKITDARYKPTDAYPGGEMSNSHERSGCDKPFFQNCEIQKTFPFHLYPCKFPPSNFFPARYGSIPLVSGSSQNLFAHPESAVGCDYVKSAGSALGAPRMNVGISNYALRKAKLMFFWVRYPNSTILKAYFPDVKFTKNNTAQLVKWYSNFREFYYIQVEKYARQLINEGLQRSEDLSITKTCELYRILNLHYNRNNHIQVPEGFRYVVEKTSQEFVKSITVKKDQEQSWKKSIYKIIARLDESVPEYFKSAKFGENLN